MSMDSWITAGGSLPDFFGMPLYGNYARELGTRLWDEASRVTDQERDEIRQDAISNTILTEDELKDTIDIRIQNYTNQKRRYSEYPAKNRATAIVRQYVLEDFRAWTLEQAKVKGSAHDRLTSIFTPEEIEEVYRKELRQKIQSLDDQERRKQLEEENADLWVTPDQLEEVAPEFVRKRLKERK